MLNQGFESPISLQIMDKKKSCNRHIDCDAFDEKLKAQGKKVEYRFHCHDDECEDCFGK